MVLQADESGDLDEISFEGEAEPNKWLSGALYEDRHGFFMPLKQTAEGNLLGNILLFLLNSDGKLFVSHLASIPYRAFDLAVPHANTPSRSFFFLISITPFMLSKALTFCSLYYQAKHYQKEIMLERHWQRLRWLT